MNSIAQLSEGVPILELAIDIISGVNQFVNSKAQSMSIKNYFERIRVGSQRFNTGICFKIVTNLAQIWSQTICTSQKVFSRF